MSDRPSTLPPDRPHLYWIDWLRFLAAFVVLIDHTRAFNWDDFSSALDKPGSLGWAFFIAASTLGKHAVVVFFVLSGWLVGGNMVERVRAGTFDAASYAADRISRVYVPLVPALLFTLAIVRVIGGNPDLRQYAVCLVGLQEVSGISKPIVNDPLWTLGYEIWFYVLAGCAGVIASRGRAVWMRFVGVIGAGLAIGICIALGWMYLGCWLIGVAGGWLRNHLTPAMRPWIAIAGAVVMAAGTWVYQVYVGILPSPNEEFDPLSPNAAQLTVACGALLLAASVSNLAPRTRAGHWIERAGGWLAAFSYTLYLTHYPVLGALRHCQGPLAMRTASIADLPRAGAWAAICMGVALVMYALFERQTPRVRRWLRTLLGGGAAPRPAPAPVRQPAFVAGTS